MCGLFPFTPQRSIWICARPSAGCWGRGATSILKELKVKGRVEHGRRHPRKACSQMLTSLVNLGTGMDTVQWEPSGRGAHPARGGPHTGLTEEVLCSDTL